MKFKYLLALWIILSAPFGLQASDLPEDESNTEQSLAPQPLTPPVQYAQPGVFQAFIDDEEENSWQAMASPDLRERKLKEQKDLLAEMHIYMGFWGAIYYTVASANLMGYPLVDDVLQNILFLTTLPPSAMATTYVGLNPETDPKQYAVAFLQMTLCHAFVDRFLAGEPVFKPVILATSLAAMFFAYNANKESLNKLFNVQHQKKQ